MQLRALIITRHLNLIDNVAPVIQFIISMTEIAVAEMAFSGGSCVLFRYNLAWDQAFQYWQDIPALRTQLNILYGLFVL